jgi:catechol 2,3-dioxygenase
MMSSETKLSTLIDHVHRVDLRVREIDSSIGFYRDLAGLEVAETDGGRASLRAPGGQVVLMLDSNGVDAPADHRATGLFHTAIRYPDRLALAHALARIAGAGHRVGAGDHGVSEALYLDDPDGNGVELYRDRPREEWPAPGPGERVRMYTHPVDLNGLLRESEAAGSTPSAAPPGTQIGHVHLQVSDLDRTISFYVDGLGLDLMARLGDQAAFFSSNGYHHHVGANAWNSRGRGPAPPNHAGLERVVFHVGDPDELERVEVRLMGTEHPVKSDDDELIVRDADDIELRLSTRT